MMHTNWLRPGHARAHPGHPDRRRMHLLDRDRRVRASLAIVAALLLAGCTDEPTRPVGTAPDDGPGTPGHVLGLAEITLTGLDSGQPTASVITAASVAELDRLRAARRSLPSDRAGARTAGPAGGGAASPITVSPSRPHNGDGTGNGTIQLEPVATSSFTVGTRGVDGYRYLYAMYRVRNAQADGTPYAAPRQNLAFYAVATGRTIAHSAVSQLQRFDGSEADASLASSLMPTGAVVRGPRSTEMVSDGPDVLQLLSEADAASILALAPAGVTDVFPYGFVVRNPSTPFTRTLAASPAEDQFDGIVTFAFKVPLQASPDDDPFSVSAVFLAVDDTEVSITQSLEEQSDAAEEAFHARAAALGATTTTLLPGGPLQPDGVGRLLCQVRVAGPAGSPTATLFPMPPSETVLLPAPIGPGTALQPATVRPAVVRCPAADGTDPTSFTVHGSVTGRAAGAYRGLGTAMVHAPPPRAGQFFPGEEIEVTWTGAVTGDAPRVTRYRIAPTRTSSGFTVGPEVSLGHQTRQIIALDLNGNGLIDFASVSPSENDVRILLNDGAGGYSSGAPIPITSWPFYFTSADVNGDGYPDLVTSNASTNDVTILLNDGTGAFTNAGSIPVGANPNGITAADLTGNGHIDLVVTNGHNSNVTILHNDGTGGFTSAGTVAVGPNPMAVVAADLNGNGHLDLAVANHTAHNLSILLNDGTGNFTSAGTAAVGRRPSHIVAADLNGNGHIDLATANRESNDVTIVLNDGTGSFTSGDTIAVGSAPHHLAAADLNGNGHLDLAVANAVSHEVSVLTNNGTGGFTTTATLQVGYSPYSVVAVDVDNDGDIDLVASSATDRSITILVNQ